MTTFDELIAFNTTEHQPFFDLCAKRCKPGDRVLDIGAGDGAFARTVPAETNLYLLEGNPLSAEKLRRSYSNVVELRLPDTLPFTDGFFDVIHCSHLIEHLIHKELYDVVREMDRCLAPGGRLMVSTPLLDDDFYNDLSHIKPYNPLVFSSYLTGAIPEMRTASIVSSDYKVVILQKRYRIVPIPYLNITYSRRGLQKVMYAISSLLRRLHFGYYQETGYTLILEKALTPGPS